jgi:hypothetical protein
MFIFKKRVKKWKNWKPRRNWKRVERELDVQARQLQEDSRPTYTLSLKGLGIHVHVVRDFYRGQVQYFPFGREETDRQKFYLKPLFSGNDLEDLIEAIEFAMMDHQQFLRKHAKNNGFPKGSREKGRRNGSSRLRVRSE